MVVPVSPTRNAPAVSTNTKVMSLLPPLSTASIQVVVTQEVSLPININTTQENKAPLISMTSLPTNPPKEGLRRTIQKIRRLLTRKSSKSHFLT